MEPERTATAPTNASTRGARRRSSAEFPSSSAEDVAAAVDAAEHARKDGLGRPQPSAARSWPAPPSEIEARVEEIAQDMTREMGKPLRESRMEAARAAAIFRFFSGEGWRRWAQMFEQSLSGATVHTRRRPLGVVALITPWNFPAAIPAWKTAPALAYGNTVVLKLAQDAPLTGLHLARAFQEAGLPDGVLNVVIGRGSEVGEPLVTDRARPRHLVHRLGARSDTGSATTRRRLGKRVQLELGGHNPLIVAADANLDAAVQAAYAGAFWSAGQKCTATRRMYVQDAVYDDFRDRLLKRIDGGHVGDPADPETEVGPIVNERQFEDVLAGIERGRQEGGSVLAGGERADPDAYLIAPTLFEGVGDDDFLSCEEVFGPVTSLYRYGTLDEAIERANAVRFGLSASVFTQQPGHGRALRERARSRDPACQLADRRRRRARAVRGTKSSGYGPHEQGRAAIEFYTEEVTVYRDV